MIAYFPLDPGFSKTKCNLSINQVRSSWGKYAINQAAGICIKKPLCYRFTVKLTETGSRQVRQLLFCYKNTVNCYRFTVS